MANPVLTSCPLLKRYDNNPVLAASDVPYAADLVFNAGVIKWHGQYVMVFRNDYGCTQPEWERGKRFRGTNIGIAFSRDGIVWQVSEKPCFDILDPKCAALFDLPEGEITRCYDPRLTVLDGEAYMTFAVDSCHGLRGGIAKTKDLENFEDDGS